MRAEPCCSVNYEYTFGDWFNQGRGIQLPRTEAESCDAAAGCACSGKRAANTETRARPCCTGNYEYTFCDWFKQEREIQQPRTEEESCDAATGCA